MFLFLVFEVCDVGAVDGVPESQKGGVVPDIVKVVVVVVLC